VNNKQRIFCEFTGDETIKDVRDFLMCHFHFRRDLILSLPGSNIGCGHEKLSSLAAADHIPEFSVSATEDASADPITAISANRATPRKTVAAIESVAFLARLGFGEVAAKIALMDADGDVDAAIRMLADEDVRFLPAEVEVLDLATIARIATRSGISGRAAAMKYLAANRKKDVG
jgi:hypothetical protein